MRSAAKQAARSAGERKSPTSKGHFAPHRHGRATSCRRPPAKTPHPGGRAPCASLCSRRRRPPIRASSNQAVHRALSLLTDVILTAGELFSLRGGRRVSLPLGGGPGKGLGGRWRNLPEYRHAGLLDVCVHTIHRHTHFSDVRTRRQVERAHYGDRHSSGAGRRHRH
jgi:hypothetical protein